MYKLHKLAKKIVDMFIPKQGTKDYRKTVRLLKDAASKLKMEWLGIASLAWDISLIYCIIPA